MTNVNAQESSFEPTAPTVANSLLAPSANPIDFGTAFASFLAGFPGFPPTLGAQPYRLNNETTLTRKARQKPRTTRK